uniref:uncharacterized protein LOC132668499 n=1 Tax=Panthera onca TaxID=9690 RepID=UPI0029548CF5|nr:uncharacterized protein LOC132668499 [Panthera onca]
MPKASREGGGGSRLGHPALMEPQGLREEKVTAPGGSWALTTSLPRGSGGKVSGKTGTNGLRTPYYRGLARQSGSRLVARVAPLPWRAEVVGDPVAALWAGGGCSCACGRRGAARGGQTQPSAGDRGPGEQGAGRAAPSGLPSPSRPGREQACQGRGRPAQCAPTADWEAGARPPGQQKPPAVIRPQGRSPAATAPRGFTCVRDRSERLSPCLPPRGTYLVPAVPEPASGS